jgi:hypothetical protein
MYVNYYLSSIYTKLVIYQITKFRTLKYNSSIYLINANMKALILVYLTVAIFFDQIISQELEGCFDNRLNEPSDNLQCSSITQGCCFVCINALNNITCGSIYGLGFTRCEPFMAKAVVKAVHEKTNCNKQVYCNCPGGSNLKDPRLEAYNDGQ